MEIRFDEAFSALFPTFCCTVLEAEVVNTPTSETLWQDIDAEAALLMQSLTAESLKTRSAIAATRQAYRLCGKDPSRYRPSGEALARRLLQGKHLYRVNTLVDLINLASLKFGYSIGGFDATHIVGEVLTLGIGRESEPYEGIGRGTVNIDRLPVYRDAQGGIGTPTTDHERTKLHTDTRRLIAIVNGYDGSAEGTQACARYMAALAERHAAAMHVALHTFHVAP